MDEDVREGMRPARGLAWAIAGLLALGVVSVGTVADRQDSMNQQLVTAAGRAADGVELPPPPPPPPVDAVAPLAPPVAPPPTVAAPPAPSAPVPPPPVAATAPSTTRPAPTTAATAAPAAAPTTVTTAPAAPARATVTVVNQHPEAVVATVNGHVFELAAGQQSPAVDMALADHGNDVVQVHVAADPSCGVGDADRYFPAGGRYRLTLTASRGMCPNFPGVDFRVTAA